MLIYATVIFILNLLGTLYIISKYPANARGSFLGFLLTLPIYGRIFGWW